MAESSSANATVSGLKVILNRSKSPERNVRFNGKTPELMPGLIINFRFQTFFCRILLFQIPFALVPVPPKIHPI
jgi:hypothetical protein